MYREGKTIYEISEWVLLTRRAVRHILQKAGEYKAPGAARSAHGAPSRKPEGIIQQSSDVHPGAIRGHLYRIKLG